MRVRSSTSFIFTLLFAIICAGCARCVVKKNELVDFYPTPARFNPDKHTWTVEPSGRIYQPKAPEAVRSALAGIRILTMPFGAFDTQFIEDRVSSLFATSPKGRDVQALFGDSKKKVKLNRTSDSGHFAKVVDVPESQIGAPDPDGFAKYQVPSCQGGPKTGELQLLQPSGVSVVSTVDDTLKVTGSSEPAAAAMNSLFASYKPVDGMSRLYQAWHAHGAAFHYVSGLPLELYPSLNKFLSANGYPKGSVHLRSWSAAGDSIVGKIESLTEYLSDSTFKKTTIEQLIDRLPGRQFILVGNAFSNDPEVFGDIARRHPQQVKSIYILGQAPGDKKRFQDAFQSLPADSWHIFTHPSEVTSAI
jgi:hypothetical protein